MGAGLLLLASCSPDHPGITDVEPADTCAVYPDGFKNSVLWQWPQYDDYFMPCFDPSNPDKFVCMQQDMMSGNRLLLVYTISAGYGATISIGDPGLTSEYMHSLSWSAQNKVFTTHTSQSFTRINTTFGTQFSTEYPYYVIAPLASPDGYYVLSRRLDLNYTHSMILLYDFNGVVIDTVNVPGADMYSWIDNQSFIVWNSLTHAYKILAFPSQHVKSEGILPGSASYMHRLGTSNVYIFCMNGNIYQYVMGQNDRYYLLKSSCGDVYSYINCSASSDGSKILAERHEYHPIEGWDPTKYYRRRNIVLMNSDGTGEELIPFPQ